ncbi:MAG: poly-gamma-glutamate hydrolase family protein [Pyrinomonadaceae bacterium]|nr:poly-gamma-glutamate hydrolase family protein [Pyrinomonadaceae bacterium]
MGEKNKYVSYKQMIEHENENTDYKIIERYGAPETAIIAIHGGGIEAGTTEVAGAIAGKDYSFYSFLGIKSKGNWDLHLDSRVFMEGSCLAMVNKADQVVSIHGCEIENAEAEGDVFLGDEMTS